MKTFITALLVLAVLVIGVGTYSVYLKNTTLELSEALEGILDSLEIEDWKECEEKNRALLEKWQKSEATLAMFTDHEDIDKVKLSFGDLNESILEKDKTQALISLSQARILLERLKKNESISLENILKFSPVSSYWHSML